jgi:hypothetical protein
MSAPPSMICDAIDPTSLEAPTLEGELTGIDLGDKRRDRRACAVIEQLAASRATASPARSEAGARPAPLTTCWPMIRSRPRRSSNPTIDLL